MSDSKFTPGPYRVNDLPLPARGYIEISGGDDLRLQIIDTRRGKHYKTSEVMEANARLIASAPDMHKEIQAYLDGPSIVEDSGKWLQAREAAFYNLLTKIKGG